LGVVDVSDVARSVRELNMTPDTTKTKPGLCFVGPMVARHKGHVTTQGEILAGLFKDAGYPVISVSHARNRYARLLDIVGSLFRRRREIDIQCLQVFGGPSFVVEDIASRVGRIFGQKIVMFLRGGAMPAFMARHPKWATRVLGRADAIVAPSEYLARAVASYGFQAQVIPNVIDISRYEYRHRRTVQPRLFWMRAFQPVWNPEMAVRVLARLRSTAPDATLVMGGQDKGFEASVRKQAAALGLNGSVRFAGFLDMPAKMREGSSADIFINTNRIDNMPVGVVEACAMGLPVVATAVGGIPDLLTHGETGLLVPDNDDQAMVDAIHRLLDDPGLAGQLSVNGRRLAERSSWARVRPTLEEVFADLIRQGDRSRGESN
jgi:glycosyltransferase involved in cell wall biosynthesis